MVLLQPSHQCLPAGVLGQIPTVHPTWVLLVPLVVGVRHGSRGVWLLLLLVQGVCVFYFPGFIFFLQCVCVEHL